MINITTDNAIDIYPKSIKGFNSSIFKMAIPELKKTMKVLI